MSEPPISKPPHTLFSDRANAARNDAAMSDRLQARREDELSATAVVYCEANFGAIDGKTANGLVRHSEKYKILSVIDSEKAGQDSGVVLDGEPNGIPICRNLTDALTHIGSIPDRWGPLVDLRLTRPARSRRLL